MTIFPIVRLRVNAKFLQACIDISALQRADYRPSVKSIGSFIFNSLQVKETLSYFSLTLTSQQFQIEILALRKKHHNNNAHSHSSCTVQIKEESLALTAYAA